MSELEKLPEYEELFFEIFGSDESDDEKLLATLVGEMEEELSEEEIDAGSL